MPTTRSGNKPVSSKAYYSEKAAPRQQRFPHRRKTVRRPDPHDDNGKKQMKFLPEMMRRRSTVQDSDDEGGESVEEVEEKGKEVPDKRQKKKKRRSDCMSEEVKEEDEDEEQVRPTPKRRRNEPPALQRSTRRRQAAAPVVAAPEVEQTSDETEPEEVPKLRLRRQSTMTQIVAGRSPVSGSVEPKFKPVKRTPRTSWGGKSSRKDARKDAKQRTLTQMVNTMTPLILDSTEAVEASETDDEADIAHHSFIFGNDEEAGVQQPTPATHVKKDNLQMDEETLRVVEHNDHSHEDEYQPTQFIEAPARRTRRTLLRSTNRRRVTPASNYPAKRAPKTRFGLLSTPEKRGVFEIPSSQSPSDTLLSSQNTPQRSGRLPLKPRSTNTPKIAETPSKRKQVTFQEDPLEQIPLPTLKKFASMIPDSEDELEGLSDSDRHTDTDDDIRGKTQAPLRNVDGPVSGINVGAETQAMLLNIDQACANADLDAELTAGEESEELGQSVVRHNAEVSQELGLLSSPGVASASIEDRSSDVADLPPLPFPSPKLRQTQTTNENQKAVTDTLTTLPIVQQLPSSPPVENFRTQPPTAMFAENALPGEADEPTTATRTLIKQPRSSSVADFRSQPTIPMFNDDEPSEDLDDVPNETLPAPHQSDIQVICSPPAHLLSGTSHSSQAEQQLHSELQMYSQYHRPKLFPSSMHVAHDSNYSYQATPHPFPSRNSTQLLSHTQPKHISQATTVDPTQISPKVTPRKPQVKKEPMLTQSVTRTPKTHRRDRSATMTPKTQRRDRNATSTPKLQRKLGIALSSPEASKPPSLFIPSSFPSPARVTMESWCSPVLGRDAGESQWEQGSLEDFSIPAPPPGEWIDEEDEEL